MDLREQLKNYIPYNEQEAADREQILRLLESGEDIYTRENKTAHLCASSWLINKNRNKVLMVYHNIFHSWSWTGGHADGERDLLAVAKREAMEETGVKNIRALEDDIFSVEILTVDGHEKRGAYVPSHLHLNITYLLEADETEILCVKQDENSGVKWFSFEDAISACSEPWMIERIYKKLNDKLINMTTVSHKTIKYVQGFAKLELNEEEMRQAGRDMGEMLSYVEKLNQLDTNGVEPMTHIFPVVNVFREDIVTNGDGAEASLRNAPQKKDGGFQVPKTIGSSKREERE